jgi:type VI secretion system protein VasG
MAIINLKALIQKLNSTCQRSLESAAGMCLSRSHYNVEIEHWLLKLLEATDNDLAFILAHYEINISQLINDLSRSLEKLKTGNAQPPALSQRVIDLAREALLLAALDYPGAPIRSAYLLAALVSEENLQRIAAGISPQFTKIPAESLRANLPELIAKSKEQEEQGLFKAENNNEENSRSSNSKTPALNQFTVNLTELARQGKIDQVTGREAEIRQIIDILMRRRQNNPILTGEPGVGKTAVVEGFALRIAQGDVPPALRSVAVYTLDLGLLQAGAGIKGEFENRLKSVIHEVKSSLHPIILFVDEAHTLVGAGAQAGQNDAANLLKPALARGELRTIAATTWEEYKKYFEQDAALTRRFQVIKIEEPDEKNATTMLRGLMGKLEQHHGVRILDEAAVAAVRLTQRYLVDRQLPDKAISVLDTACARLATRATTQAPEIEDYQNALEQLETEVALIKREVASDVAQRKRLVKLIETQTDIQKKLADVQKRWQQEKELIATMRTTRDGLEKAVTANQVKEMKSLRQKLQVLTLKLKNIQGELPLLQECVTAQTVAEVIAEWTGIPLGRMVSDEIHNIINLETHLQKRVIGQSHALKAITQSLQTSRAQLADPRKPIGVFLLVGPSGVGKTETALALAEILYGGEQNLSVINLSEFKEEHKVSLLMGSPPGYVGYGEGGVLTEAVRRRPYSLVLLDEVEKAHPGVQDIFYQVFDKGTLRDGQGRDINFKNTIIILTSNVGSNTIIQLCNKSDSIPSAAALAAAIRPELLKVFKPAFLGRVTLVPYLPLGDKLLQQIVQLQLKRIEKRIAEHYQAKFSYSDELTAYIAARCKEVETGARAVDHLLNKSLLPELSAQFLAKLAEGSKIANIHIGLENEKLIYHVK